MRKLACFLILILLNSITVFSIENDIKRILFIGNSYTFAYSMPKIIQELIDESGDKAVVESVAVGGFYLKNHSQNEQTINKIKEGNWDIIVIQEQSQLPALSNEIVGKESYPYLFSLDSLIDKYSFCSKKYLFMTWGRKIGDTANCANFPKLCSYQGMDKELRLRYIEYADNIGANVVPAGIIWNYIRANYPEIELYERDGSHPSKVGALANAYSFYTFLYNKDPFDIIDYDGIDTNTVMKIKYAVSRVWNNFKYDNKPRFITEINSNFNLSVDLMNHKFKKYYDNFSFNNIEMNDSNNIFQINSKCDKFNSTYSKRYNFENGNLIIDDYLKLLFHESKTTLNVEVITNHSNNNYLLRIYSYDNIILKSYTLGNFALNIDIKYFPREFFIDLEQDNRLIERLLIIQ